MLLCQGNRSIVFLENVSGRGHGDGHHAVTNDIGSADWIPRSTNKLRRSTVEGRRATTDVQSSTFTFHGAPK